MRHSVLRSGICNASDRNPYCTPVPGPRTAVAFLHDRRILCGQRLTIRMPPSAEPDHPKLLPRSFTSVTSALVPFVNTLAISSHVESWTSPVMPKSSAVVVEISLSPNSSSYVSAPTIPSLAKLCFLLERLYRAFRNITEIARRRGKA